MKISVALELLRQSLAEHGLTDWTGDLDNARRRFGMCQFDKKHISLSRPLCELNSSAEVKDTILHEVAHALAWERHGVNCGHDDRWKSICVEIGARPHACYDDEVIQPAAPWVLVNRDSGEVYRSYMKRPNRDWSSLWIRGRKDETLGKLEIRANKPINKTADLFAADDSVNTAPEPAFNAQSVAEFREKLRDHTQTLAAAHGLSVSKIKGRYSDYTCEFTLTFEEPLPDGVDPQRLEFEALADMYNLTKKDYLRSFQVNGRQFQLAGFKPNNRKYPIIGISETGQRFKFERSVIEEFTT